MTRLARKWGGQRGALVCPLGFPQRSSSRSVVRRRAQPGPASTVDRSSTVNSPNGPRRGRSTNDDEAVGGWHAGRAVLDRLEVAEVAVELVVGVLAHGAGAEHGNVRLRAVGDRA